ncbi:MULTISPECIES: DNA-3-methyladenine glycosylase I [unclassified Sphingobium]|uniref:DNA-3-methyladenine glycosylase I n=1 Tax=unclassified Sphingobium TaxID=2611147 RepID=UPI0035A631D2
MAMKRCEWAESDPLMQAYHDSEWGVPQRDGRMLWEMLMLEGFQAGLAWIIVLRKREAFRAAFAEFDPGKVALFGTADVERLMGDGGIIRARAKIEATIKGAQIFLDMAAKGEDFADYCWSFVGGEPIVGNGREWIASSDLSARISKDMKRRGFKFVGPTIVYAWMQAVGLVNDHAHDCFRRQQLLPA